MPFMGKKTPRKPALESLCDGKNFLNSAQAATYLKTTQEAIRQITMRGGLCPARLGRDAVFTRGDLDRYRGNARELAIAKLLVDGAHPLDVYLDSGGKYPMREVVRVLHEWSRLSGVWLVEGPRGSYARWLARLGLMRCTPRELRRVVEYLCADQLVGARVRVLFSDQRKAPASSESAAAALSG